METININKFVVEISTVNFFRFALDLYKNRLITDVEIPFTNPFRKTTMVGYNHRSKVIFICPISSVPFPKN